MHKHVLVPLDGSSFGEGALRPAFALARRTGAEVTLLSVQDPWAASAAGLPFEEREEYLERIRARRAVETPVRVVIRSGRPVDQILQEAESAAVDLIIMSTHGRGGVTRLWLGSVADQCLRHAKVPLLLIRPEPGAQISGDGAFLPGRIIVPLDGSVGSERALEDAGAMALAFGVPVLVVRALPPDGPKDTPSRGGPEHEGRAEAYAYLDGMARRLERMGVRVSTTVVGNPSPADAILTEAAGDPIVMSTHARSPIARALIGSVADKVVRGTRGAVLLVPPPTAPTPQPVTNAAVHADS